MVILQMFRGAESGQAHAIESLAASILILSTIVFAIQATAITPLTVSTSNQHIETQQQRMASGVLENAKYTENPGSTSALKEAVLFWNTSNQQFYNASSEGYLGTYPNNEFGDLLNGTFGDRRIATNIYLTYERPGVGSSTKQMLYMGEPSNNAVTATTNIVIYDDDALTAPGESGTVNETNGYFASNVNPSSNVYNVVEVRIVVWRI